ncbi:MFS transporter [Nocardioides coralli]|uniref:MFS transporter n=1 Tax=Nocardioides coralli TaxID=2872154 RepID=UPI001CA41F9D|nr:MFS transporter [Nocardioides coralli]QZY28671.1 MFS transporter [Nocardioides coralli]
MPDEARPRLLTRSFVLLGVADLAYFTAIGVAILALPLTVTGRIGSDEAGAGLAFGAFGVTALICRPFAGRLSDSHGRRPLMIAGATVCGVGMLLVPFVESLALVIAIRLLQGVAEAAFFVAGFALLADLAPPSRMGEALSYNSLGLYLGIALGPPLGEVLARTWSLDVAWYGATVLALLAAALTLLLREPPRTREGGGHGRLIHVPAIPLALGFFASLAAVSGFLAFAALHSREIGMSNTSTALLTYGLVVVGCRIAFARIPDRLPSLPLAAASLVAIGVGLTVMAAWQAPAGLILGVVIAALGVTFATPAFFSAIFATATPSERGAASGTASAFIDLGLGAGPVLMGLVARAEGIPAAFAIGAGIAFVGCAWTLLLARRVTRALRQSLGTSTQSAM